MLTGEENVAVCHPLPSSLENVTSASWSPAAFHSAPTCVPVFAADLKKRTPLTVPATSELNFTPRTTELASPPSGTAGVTSPKSDALGTTAPDAEEAGPVPSLLTAATLN